MYTLCVCWSLFYAAEIIAWLVAYSAEQEGIKADPVELSQFIDFFKRNKLESESFFVGANQCEFYGSSNEIHLCS